MKKEVPTLVKWAGGKKQLIEQFKPLFPKKISTYIDPFVGGGAIAFYMLKYYPEIKKVILSDINEELINVYNIVKENVENLIIELKQHKEYHMERGKDYYLQIRAADLNELTPLTRAARFIYLNKTCFNGLYRVNSKGGFNVPIGDQKNPGVCIEEDLREISKLLKKVKIKVMPFEKIITIANAGDFIYFDPPYYPLKGKPSFTTYAKNKFLEEEQEMLAEIFKKLDKKGCKVMLSNSDTKFIKDLYKDYNITKVKATRMINCNAKNRGKINEVVVRNYQIKE
tara:strand:- start:292 stop:1140 length:849 start_codon:yes stop_codon:yes gene_type:complete